MLYNKYMYRCIAKYLENINPSFGYAKNVNYLYYQIEEKANISIG